MNTINIAIDGPSSAGKSTTAKMLAQKLGIIYVDTGALYRALAYYALSNNIDPTDVPSVDKMLETVKISLEYKHNIQKVLVNNEDVTERIRTPEISIAALNISKIPSVREFLLATQRDIAAANSVIMDGRDIGTVVLPNAEFKVFLTAKPVVRAARRYKELIISGIECTQEDVLRQINERDHNDTHREIAPLKPAPDSIFIDSTYLTINEVVKIIYDLVSSDQNIVSPAGE